MNRPDCPPMLTREAIAVELLATATEGVRRADRAMAHILQASLDRKSVV